MKLAGNHPARGRNDLKTTEKSLVGRDRPDFGTVRHYRRISSCAGSPRTAYEYRGPRAATTAPTADPQSVLDPEARD